MAQDLASFRSQFPALARLTYLNTPVATPGPRPVLDALRQAQADWEAGQFSWQAWEADGRATRVPFAALVGGEASSVALMSSVAESASMVAASLPTGRVVVGEREFRSNLLPWEALQERGFDVALVPATDGVVRTEALVEAIDDRTVLVAISEVQSATGFRVHLAPIAGRAREVGARLFVNLTQTLGALRFDPAIRPDFVVAHGYKWLLGIRGAAWLHVRADRLEEVRPLVPNWHSMEDPYADYYGPVTLATDGRKLETSMSWFPWVAARAALDLVRSVDPADAERRCLELAAAFRRGVEERGFRTVGQEAPTQIVVLRVPEPESLKSQLAEAGVVASVRGGDLRFGFHAFNDDGDVEAALQALGRG